jgi:hypothetical protein
MNPIRQLFDPTRALNRPIEKVITYQSRTDSQLLSEVSEYVATDHIEEQFSELLKKMQSALQGGGGHEIGVWVSGFYGSGKSSFTKYLGFALDRSMKVGEQPFLELLKNQLPGAQVKALLNQVSTTYDASVIFLDLASEMLAGASMEDVSTVLYYKVLQWAGYSEDLKVAELERMLERDGNFDKFLARAQQELDGTPWAEARNQPLVANEIASRLAHEFYPKIFLTAESFQNITLHVNKSEFKRAEEMVELIRRKSGKKNILFIVDEVGQYVSAKSNLITNLDGLAKNLKQIGGGTVWLFATAQQTLTEDNQSAMFNARDLYKLKDRFPIGVHLEASDIREICHKRLLTKSSSGEHNLAATFDSSGPSLRTSTELANGGVYEVELTKKIFVDLYPFLPAHFEILLNLLGRLARKTGGLGLRSAIKVVQEVLIERAGRDARHTTLADAPIGTLANTVTLYDALRRDIESSFGYIVEGVKAVGTRFPNQPLYQYVAKSIAVLQILENLPVTTQNIAALLQPDVTTASQKDAVEQAVEAMTKDSMIPLGWKNGGLRFLTQAAVTLQRQFDLIEYRQADLRARFNGVIRAIFNPLPSARLNGVRPVTAGLKVSLGGGQAISLEGEKEAIAFQVEFVAPGSYDTTRTERENDSRSASARATLFLMARSDSDADDLAVTLVRCQKFLDHHRNSSDPETTEFVRIVEERMNLIAAELERKLSAALLAGSFVSHGSHQSAAECGTDVLDAARAYLAAAAGRVFDRYAEAPHQAEAGLAEKFLKTSLDRIATAEDPLGLVVRPGGKAQIRPDSKAISSIKDYLGQNGQVEGRRLLDHFSDPAFGWSKDTTRYLLAAAFVGSEIKLRIAGKDFLVKSDEVYAAFASNRSLGAVGIGLRQDRPDPEILDRASTRLRTLTGEAVLPLEDEIANAAKKHFPTYQAVFSPLAVELRSLGLTAASQADRAENLSSDLTEVVGGDGSDAINRLGGIDSPLYESLVWAKKLKKALDQGLREKLGHLKQLQTEIHALPDSGIPAKLKDSAAETLDTVADILARDSFFDEASSIGSASTLLDQLVAATTTELATQQKTLGSDALASWQASADWFDLKDDDRSWLTAEVEKLTIKAEGTLAGLRKLISHDYSLNHRLRELAETMKTRAAEWRTLGKQVVAELVTSAATQAPEVTEQELLVPKVFKSANDIQLLITALSKLRAQISASKQIRITWKQID